MGDTNCNFLFSQDQTENLSYPNSTVKQLDSLYKLFGYTQIIHDATRVTPSTSTLIDHIATNNNSNISHSGVLKTTFSDHYMDFCARKLRGAFKKEHKYIMSRKMNKFNQTDFMLDVINIPWETIVRSYETVEEVVYHFTETLNLVIEKHAPLQQRRVSQKYCLWLTPDLNKLRKFRDKLKKSAVKFKSKILMESYRHVHNKVNLLNRALRKKDYSNKIQENVGNLRQTWKIANQILNKSS